jgi:PAS domain S-box-containing protein
MTPDETLLRSELESRLRFETLIADLSSKFISLPTADLDGWILDAQRRVCECLGLDVSALWQWPADNPQYHTLTHFHRPPGGPPTPDLVDAQEHFPWCLRQLETDNIIAVSSVENLPADAARDQSNWRRYGIKTALIFPLSAGGGPPIGALSFNDMRSERVWPEALVSRLQLVAQIFSAALVRKHADQALREREARLNLAAVSAGAGGWDLDVASGRLWGTPEAKKLYGFAADQDVTLPDVLERVHPEDREQVRARLREATRSRKSYDAEYRVVMPDGTIRWVSARGRPHASQLEGDADRLMGFSVDITARKHAEARLEQSEARYRSLVELASDAVVVHRNNEYVYANPAALDLFGVDLETLVAAKVLDFVDPADRQALKTRIQSAIDTGVVGPMDEIRIRRPDGTVRVVEGSGTTIMFEGRSSVLAVLRDVTERREVAAALKDRTDRLAMALTSARMGAWDVKLPEMTITWEESREDLFGLGPGRFPRHVSELVAHLHPDDRETAVEAFMRITRAAGTLTIEARVIGPDGSEHWHQVFARSEGGGGATPDRMAGLSLDITDRKRREVELREALEEVRRLRDKLRDENVYLRQEVKGLQSGLRIVGQSPAILRVVAQAQQVATTSSTVLLTGETGTGKERFATLIHELSPRRERAMVRVNCAAIPATLIESELFGREKGAYTGALSRQAGRFELAHGSTLFLDEIADLPPEVQVKLLRVLQERQIERLGSPRSIPVDVRIIAATNQDLEAAVRAGRFREDLYYRFNVFPIVVPPLRERREDIPLLVAALVDELSATMGKRADAISRASMDALMKHSWPGNIRELRNVLERAMILAAGPVLDVDAPLRNVEDTASLSQGVKDTERQQLLEVLQRTGWRIRGPHGAAQLLGLKPTTLEHRMARLGITRPGLR